MQIKKSMYAKQIKYMYAKQTIYMYEKQTKNKENLLKTTKRKENRRKINLQMSLLCYRRINIKHNETSWNLAQIRSMHQL